MISILLGISLVIATLLYLKWKVYATVLAAWISEKNIAPPDDKDLQRLIKWVVQKMFKKN